MNEGLRFVLLVMTADYMLLIPITLILTKR